MYHFLKHLYLRTESHELGGILGGMSMLADGSPADPAIRNEWKRAVAYALQGGQADSLKLG